MKSDYTPLQQVHFDEALNYLERLQKHWRNGIISDREYLHKMQQQTTATVALIERDASLDIPYIKVPETLAEFDALVKQTIKDNG